MGVRAPAMMYEPGMGISVGVLGLYSEFMKNILEAIENGADSATFAALEIPATYRAAVVLKSEQEMFAGV
jgi:hypothetical protein